MSLRFKQHFLCISIFCLLFLVKNGIGQTKLYANKYGIKTTGVTGVTNPEYGLNNSETEKAYLYSVLLGSVDYQLKFNYESPIPKGVKIYLKTTASSSSISIQSITLPISDQNVVEGSNITPITITGTGTYLVTNSANDFNAIKISITGINSDNVFYAYFYPFDAPLTFKSSTIAACGSYNLIENLKYTYSELTYEVLKFGESSPISSSPNIIESGDYMIRVTDPDGGATKNSSKITVTINPIPSYTLSSNYIKVAKGQTVALPTVTPSSGTIVFKNNNGTIISNINIPSHATTGFYTYSVTVSNSQSCQETRNFIIYVSDSSDDCSLEERIYASSQTHSIPSILFIPVGNVFNPENAVDKNLRTKSTMYSTLNLLGLTTFYQELKWTQTIPKGSTVTIKISSSASVANVIGALSIQQRKGSSNTGSLIPVRGGLIDLLASDNETYFSFTATDDIDAIYLIYGGVLGIGTRVYIYDAWFTRAKANGILDNCNEKDVIDVLAGAGEYLKGILNAASITSSITNQWNIADGDLNTFATMNSLAQAGTYIQTTAVFKTLTMPTDTTVIVLSTNYNTLNLLGDFLYLQRYLGDVKVGEPIYLNNPTLITLLNNFQTTKQAILLHTNDMPYDKVSIILGGAVSVLNVNTRIYEVYRKPYIPPLLADLNNQSGTISFCSGEVGDLSFQDMPCTEYEWYQNSNGGTALSRSTIINQIKNTPGTYNYFIQANRYGCKFGERVSIQLVVKPTPPPPDVHLNSSSAVTF